ncbi:MAG: putative PEP-binding protein, partial [Polyangiales bacterium]
LVDACATELGAGAAKLPVGMMVEVPSAALQADAFARHADFFAIGTNDLTPHALGLNRDDPRTAAAASPLHPTVLGLIARALDAADAAGIPCSICGDMATDPIGLALALGLGCRNVSVPARIVPLTKAVVRTLDLDAAAETARRALSCSSVEEVRALALGDFGQQLTTLWRDGDPG